MIIVKEQKETEKHTATSERRSK